MKYINKYKREIIVCIILLVPMIIQRISIIPAFSSTSNDWVGFWGSYIGAIVGACVAVYVLMETLKDNKKMQTRTEVIEFCNCIIEKSSIFAQKYEESFYNAHVYMSVHETKKSLSEEEFNMYKQFVASHHSAKAILYEIKTYLNIRKNIEVFNTPKYGETLNVAEEAYKEYKEFEVKVGKAEKLADVDDKSVIKVIEKFLNLLKQYEKELLDEISGQKVKNTKTLREIYKDAKDRKLLKQEDFVICCKEAIKKEIDSNKVRVLIYKEECQSKLDVKILTFLGEILLKIITVLFVAILWKLRLNDMTTIMWMCVYFVILLVVIVLCSKIMLKEKKKYLLLKLILEEIEADMKEELLPENIKM